MLFCVSGFFLDFSFPALYITSDMEDDMRAEYEKIAQAINFFACKSKNRTITKLHVLKAVYLADRWHLRMYGRTVTNDCYFAMPYGPVASETKKMFEFLGIPPEAMEYAAQYLNPHDDCKITSVKEPDLDVFSKTDLDALNAAWEIYCKEKKDIVNFTHRFPEWMRRLNDLEKKKSVPMNMLDFFADAPKSAEYCPANSERVNLNKAHFAEMSYL